MTPPSPSEKACRTCGETKNAVEYHQAPTNRDGLATQCKDCVSEYGRQYRKAMKEKLGEEEFLARQRAKVARSREKTGNVRGSNTVRAGYRALAALRDRHRKEYDYLYELAKRGEL